MPSANELQAENDRLKAENEQLMHLNLFAGEAWAEQAASIAELQGQVQQQREEIQSLHQRLQQAQSNERRATNAACNQRLATQANEARLMNRVTDLEQQNSASEHKAKEKEEDIRALLGALSKHVNGLDFLPGDVKDLSAVIKKMADKK